MKLVVIAFRKLQTFLFTVPALRAMVGANALLDRVLRHELRDRAIRHSSKCPPGFAFPAAAIYGDPLEKEDNPAADFEEHGILARDGGHFEAYFEPENAAAFARAAAELIQGRVPGLLFDIFIDGERQNNSGAAISAELPHFQVCQMSGRGPASGRAGPEKEREWISHDTHVRLDAGNAATWRDTNGIVALLQKQLALSQADAPEDFNGLCGSGYLAVIHADGNGVGAHEPGPAVTNIAQRLDAQAFFRSARGAIRAGVKAAIAETFKDCPARVRPYQILMLGGDDLLMVCQAGYALGFLVHYAKALEACGAPVTIGAGVAIAKPNVPFHRLHAIAESLADSAKRLHRAWKDASGLEVSVADWAVYTGSWAGDPVEARIAQHLREVNEWRLVLTGRPLALPGVGACSVEGLLATAKQLDDAVREKRCSRSQLRSLCDELGKGRLTGCQGWRALPPGTRAALEGAGFSDAWQDQDEAGRWVQSRIPDCVEVFEISRLGTQAIADGSRAGAESTE